MEDTHRYPKISIVTPSYNQVNYLEETILSVVNQGYPNLEYIIIDGGSSDGSVDIIKKYEQHVSYWVSEADEGLYHAIQKGFERSTGEIMAWLNSDDMYHHKSLFAVAELFSALPQVNWVMGRNTCLNDEGLVFQIDSDEGWSKWRLYNFNRRNFIQQESVFWRRLLWVKAGSYINTDFTLASDFELWMRFFRYEQLYSTNVLLAGFRFRNEKQKSRDYFEDYVTEVQKIIDTELQICNEITYVRYCKFIKAVVLSLIPIQSWRKKLLFNVWRIPPTIILDNRGNLGYRKAHR